MVAADRAAVSRAADKTGSLKINERREVTPAALILGPVREQSDTLKAEVYHDKRRKKLGTFKKGINNAFHK